MTNSSAQTIYSYTSDGDIITISDNTVTMNGVLQSPADTITIDLSSITGTVGVEAVYIDNYWSWKAPIPFEDSFPEWEDFQKMCKEYPGLEQAYEKLKTFYVLCKNEWETKKKEQK